MSQLLAFFCLAATAACHASLPAAVAAMPPAQLAAMPACPEGAAAAALALVAWGKPFGEPRGVTCLDLRAGGEALWLVEGFWLANEDADSLVAETAVMTPAGRIIGREATSGHALATADWLTHRCVAVDLDGDATDEVLCIDDSTHGGSSESELTARRVAGGQLLGTSTVPYAYADTDGGTASCSSTYSIVPAPHRGRRVVVVTTRHGQAEGACLPAGRHVFGWDGAALAEIVAP